ncbi:hypothetical protein [Burkholderia pseudomallei]|uniref:hypothetical protein n=1 Tax=Burkholderia pseudomallei TaxID=28450 RepID=UPI00190A6975|nr:hypothetical protein [Burkholderia pseudomallei]MBK3338655.1 hypothetical protein [Burkholderia pseudomallei]
MLQRYIETPGRVVKALLITASVFLLSLVGTVVGSAGGYKPDVMAYWLQAFGTIGAILWTAWNVQRVEKFDRQRRSEQALSEIGNLAYDTLHFVARNVGTMRQHPSGTRIAFNGTEFSELLQRMTAVRQLPLETHDIADVIALRSDLVDAIELIIRHSEQGELNDSDLQLLKGYQQDLKNILDRRNSSRRIRRS